MTPISHAAYTNAATQTTSKEKILLMLIDGAIKFVRFAHMDMAEGNVAAKGENISKTIAILTELDGALDRDIGGELAENLAALYEYMNIRLLQANLKNDSKALDEVESILNELKEGFEGAAKQISCASSMHPRPSELPAQERSISFAV